MIHRPNRENNKLRAKSMCGHFESFCIYQIEPLLIHMELVSILRAFILHLFFSVSYLKIYTGEQKFVTTPLKIQKKSKNRKF